MRLSRPVAIGLMVLCALIVLWLVAQTLSPGDDPRESAPTPTGSVSPTFAGPDEDEPFEEQSGAPDPQEGDTGPTGTDTRDWDDVDACRNDVLPPELGDVSDDIEAGGPFDYDRDGITFQNREGYLPQEQSGYYREYTVETPGLDHRGARRIVTGGGEVDPEVWYYTDDHYESFCEFAPSP